MSDEPLIFVEIALPQRHDFVTLSPIPCLNRRLATQTDDAEHGHVEKAILDQSVSTQDMRAMATRYLLLAKRDDGMPFDPVARFQLGNGAQVYDIHADADTSANGLKQSSGAMVNYLYDLPQTQRRNEDFALKSVIVAAKPAQALLTAKLSAKLK
jgi:malonyl-CoA decarboxylase